MLFENIGIIDETFAYQKDIFVCVQYEKITYIGKTRPVDYIGETYNGKNKLLMSGLYNTHSHAAMTLMRGYGEGLTLLDWLHKRIFPFEAKLTGEDIYNGAILAFAEMIRFGTVALSDMYFFGEDMKHAVLDSGIKANINMSVNGSGSLYELPIYQEMISLRDEGRMKVGYCLHAEYTSTPQIVFELAYEAKSRGVIINLHMSETKAEHDDCKKHHGVTPARYFEQHGIFDNRVIAAHCVYIEDEDIEILKKHNVYVSCNPVSNFKLGSGTPPVKKLLDSDVNVVIGTDSAASNNNLNMFEEIKLFAMLSQRTTSAVDALKAATVTGAEAMGRENCGSVAVGNKADLIVLDLNGAHMTPVHDMLSNVVYSAQGSDVVLTMVDGEVLYCDGEYKKIDLEKIKYIANRSVSRIIFEL
ncbi:MAG: hypothetical protein A2Y17_09385 [Clostridiales bacterium GWF2_38_85]|nr:MAG: hypothetical protein A2Y17_09385 [Clostridiales bacterium GWF2_38_85]HBL83590.1 amidohydrolase [Clostridiales bacterium]